MQARLTGLIRFGSGVVDVSMLGRLDGVRCREVVGSPRGTVGQGTSRSATRSRRAVSEQLFDVEDARLVLLMSPRQRLQVASSCLLSRVPILGKSRSWKSCNAPTSYLEWEKMTWSVVYHDMMCNMYHYNAIRLCLFYTSKLSPPSVFDFGTILREKSTCGTPW
jgi:hypothetical protein